jgi:ABC-type amino acid transport substrate-binding protein
MSGDQDYPIYTSYRDIPGVTEDEIAAIEAFRTQGRTFVYGMTNNAECFEDRDGTGGYSVLFCQWLSDLFKIPFTPAIYNWTELLNGLERGNIDFTGELAASPDRLRTYLMTSAIAERSITITRLKGRVDLSIIATRRVPSLGFLSGSTTYPLILQALSYQFNAVFVNTAEEAYTLIRAGELDAFFDEGQEGEAEIYNDLSVSEALPLIYSPVSLAARKTELSPIITVVQKYLDQGALYHLVGLYNQGYRDYLTYRFHASLTEEEMAYVEDHDGSRGMATPIPLSMEPANYPVAFFNTTENAWQGIAWDVLKEIESISALHFEVVNGRDITWAENQALLERGEASVVTELIRTNRRENRFLWAEEPYSKDNFALLSRIEMKDLGINEVLYSSVGIVADTAYTELFQQWFPNHPHTVKYPNAAEALSALKRGDIDLFMGTQNTLLTLTNYMEEPGFKANMIFYRTADSYFGFNQQEAILCSIISKAQALVDTELIENRWLSRVFDYRNKLVRLRQPYLLSFSVVLGLVIFLLMVLLRVW